PQAPVISSEIPTYVNTSLSLEGTAADEVTGVARVEYRIDDEEWLPASGAAGWFKTIDTQALTEGDHTIYLRSTDRVGLVSELTQEAFLVDRSNPSGVVQGTWGPSEFRNSEDFDISGSASDENGISSVEFSSETIEFGAVAVDGNENDSPRNWSLSVDS